MQKIRVVLDRAKIESEKRFSYPKMQAAVDGVLVDRYGLAKTSDGFYIGKAQTDAYADFMGAILFLKDCDWFMDNVADWRWFNSDDSSDPDDFAIDDIKAHYLSKRPVVA